MYGLPNLFSLYPSHLSVNQIRTLVLHTLPATVSNHIATTFLSDVVPPAIPPPSSIQCISNCFILQPVPDKSNWDNAYQQNLETKLILDHLSVNAPFDQTTIVNLPVAYRTAIARNQITFLGGRLVYYEAMFYANKHIYRIIVPSSLRHKTFNLIHATPVTGHVGEYKTVYRIRLRFFWPRMRSDIKAWIQQCPHCMLTYRWRRRGQELMFSRPVSSPFAILHVYL